MTRGARRARRDERQEVAALVAERHDGLATRPLLAAAGITRHEVRREVDAGRWNRLGRHTLGITVRTARGAAAWRWATWEAGPGAALDGVTALLAAGLKGWDEADIHVNVPPDNGTHPLPGVRMGRSRMPATVTAAGVLRVAPAPATIRAAQQARTDRQAATLVAMAVQQRIVHPLHLTQEWSRVLRSSRRGFLDQVIPDVCGGAEALAELDFATICRRRGLPEPTRQAVRRGQGGRIFVDAAFEDYGVNVEIDGAQHGWGLAPVDDALRDNATALGGQVTLRVPVLGLRVAADAFLDQIEVALRARGWRG